MANTTAAAEGLHRLMMPGKAIDDETYKKLKRNMLRTLDDVAHRNHLGQQLRHANEHYLSARLRQLAEHLGPAGNSIIGDVPRWAHLVSTIRNDLTHPDDVEAEDRPEVKGSDRLFLSESVYLVTVLCILQEAGVKSEVLASAVRRMSVQWATKEKPGIVDRLSALG
jgi:hypothetical protein